MLTLALPFEKLADNNLMALVAQIAVLGWFLLYLYFAMRRVYREGWATTGFKASVAVLAYMLIVSLVVENAGGFLIIKD